MGDYFKKFLKKIFFISIILIISQKTIQDIPVTLDWRFNDLRSKGVNVEEVFKVRCIFGYYYYVWQECFISIPLLNDQEARIKCLEIAEGD